MTQFSVATHNLHDQAGTPTAFADLIGFTEAIPRAVDAEMKKAGYRTVRCWRQLDLVIAYNPKVFRKVGIARYKKVVDGVKKVTPDRGTFKVRFELLSTREKFACFLEHRINAAFPPYIRGEGMFRRGMWHKHTKVSLDWIQQTIDAGNSVIAFGDLNTPAYVRGYDGVLGVEIGDHYDRIGVDGFRLGKVEYLSKEGSDHPRLRVQARTIDRQWHAVTDQKAA